MVFSPSWSDEEDTIEHVLITVIRRSAIGFQIIGNSAVYLATYSNKIIRNKNIKTPY